MLPSSAYVTLPWIFQPIVVSRLFFEGTGLSPVLSIMNPPVP